MRSYEAARSLFGFLSFLSWVVIVLGCIAAVLGGAAAADMMRNGGEFIAFIAGAIPGVILALTGFFGLVFAQIGRAGVDTAEYSQQSLQISRDQLEVSRNALRQGEEVKSGFVSLATQLSVPASASYADQSTQSRDVAREVGRPVSGATYAKIIDYKGRDIHQLAQGFGFAGTEFRSLEAAKSYIDGLDSTPKTLLSSSS
jgi:hypothetical protein